MAPDAFRARHHARDLHNDLSMYARTVQMHQLRPSKERSGVTTPPDRLCATMRLCETNVSRLLPTKRAKTRFSARRTEPAQDSPCAACATL